MSVELAAARRLSAFRLKSVIDGGIECNAQLVEEAGHGRGILGRSLVCQSLCLDNDAAAQATIVSIKHRDNRDQGVTVSGAIGLQAGDSGFNSLRHGGLLSLTPAENPICADHGAHRLCESSK